MCLMLTGAALILFDTIGYRKSPPSMCGQKPGKCRPSRICALLYYQGTRNRCSIFPIHHLTCYAFQLVETALSNDIIHGNSYSAQYRMTPDPGPKAFSDLDNLKLYTQILSVYPNVGGDRKYPRDGGRWSEASTTWSVVLDGKWE